MPTRSELEDVARDWIALWTVPVDWQRFDSLHAEIFEDCSSAGRSNTKTGFAEGLAAMVRAFPDLKTHVEGVVVDEARDMVAVRWTAEGTNRERYLGVGPTNQLTTIRGIEIIEIQRSKIVRRWGEWDISDHIGSAWRP